MSIIIIIIIIICVLAIVYVYIYAHTCVQMLRIMSEIMSEGPQNVSVNVDGRKMMQVGQVIVTPITSRSSLTPVGLGLGRRSSTASSTTRHPVVEPC